VRRANRWREGPPGNPGNEKQLAARAHTQGMSAYDLTPLAKAGIFEIWASIAGDNEDTAGRV
jgi:hypothetical protein